MNIKHTINNMTLKNLNDFLTEKLNENPSLGELPFYLFDVETQTFYNNGESYLFIGDFLADGFGNPYSGGNLFPKDEEFNDPRFHSVREETYPGFSIHHGGILPYIYKK